MSILCIPISTARGTRIVISQTLSNILDEKRRMVMVRCTACAENGPMLYFIVLLKVEDPSRVRSSFYSFDRVPT